MIRNIYVLSLFYLYVILLTKESVILSFESVDKLEIPVIINQVHNLSNCTEVLFTLDQKHFYNQEKYHIIQSFCIKYGFSSSNCHEFAQLVDERIKSIIIVPNKNFERHNDAIHGEVLNIELSRENSMSSRNPTDLESDVDLSYQIDHIVNRIDNILQNNIINQDIGRICVIHSCMLQNSNPSILQEMLRFLETYHLITELEAIWILNYGIEVPLENLYTTISQKSRNKIDLIQMSNKTHYFEVPTLQVLYQLSTRLGQQSENKDVQILYLHSKGISYTKSPIQIENWRRYMLYYLIKYHKSWYHILASQEFDAIGCEYSSIDRFFSGNFFWTHNQYITSLEPIYYHRHSKYDAEKWILSGKNPRIYVPFNTGVNLNDYDLPVEIYAADYSNNVISKHIISNSHDNTTPSISSTGTYPIEGFLKYRNTTHCIGRILPIPSHS